MLETNHIRKPLPPLGLKGQGAIVVLLEFRKFGDVEEGPLRQEL